MHVPCWVSPPQLTPATSPRPTLLPPSSSSCCGGGWVPAGFWLLALLSFCFAMACTSHLEEQSPWTKPLRSLSVMGCSVCLSRSLHRGVVAGPRVAAWRALPA